MTFEGQYLTYKEFTDLGGSAIGELPFGLLEFEARRKIDIRTQNRLKNKESIPQEVKLCEKKLIESISSYNNTTSDIANKGNVKSENTDGYSISYISAGEIKDIIISKDSELDDIIKTYLAGVIYESEHLLYLGVE